MQKIIDEEIAAEATVLLTLDTGGRGELIEER